VKNGESRPVQMPKNQGGERNHNTGRTKQGGVPAGGEVKGKQWFGSGRNKVREETKPSRFKQAVPQ